MSHTPGPWRAEPNGGDDEDMRALFVGKDRDGGFTVIADCRSKWMAQEIGGDEEANAKLIAAAPDLLEALQKIALQGGDIVERWSAEIARAAIAKATK